MTLEEYCRGILESGSLEAKLRPPPAGIVDEPGREPVRIDAPARSDALALRSGAGRLPPMRRLGEPEAAAQCLARFAHHELMAVELFAWALLRWPDLPDAQKQGWLHTLADEQRHFRLYARRIQALGSAFEAHVCSDYFWRHAPAIAASPHGARAFLCVMGLTLEQANLDFSAHYARAFRSVGDVASAEVCELVHRDEIGHVRQAAIWVERGGGSRSLTDIYLESVPGPFGPARAKGRAFLREARVAAGLDPEFIEFIRTAKPPQATPPPV